MYGEVHGRVEYRQQAIYSANTKGGQRVVDRWDEFLGGIDV